MIISFASKETEKVWKGAKSKKLPTEIQHTARRKLRMLNNAKELMDLRIPPNNRLEALKGVLKGLYSIRINGQWRICLYWFEGNCHDVQIIDYH
jgi:proteic killer suppression protein